MKIRKETSGIHLFDRNTGIHVLLDEVQIEQEQLDISPRILSLAITNKCNCKCDFCYQDKTNEELDKEFIFEVVKTFDENGGLELNIGGGEPFIHPDIEEICSWIWENTNLGINITTNGLLLDNTKISGIAGKISTLRVSIDEVEPLYSQKRNYKLDDIIEKIKQMKDKINIGINIIFRPNRIETVRKIIELGINLGVKNVLIIPEHRKGNFILETKDWEELEQVIEEYKNIIDIFVTYDATKYISNKFLETEKYNEILFSHISSDKKIKKNSYDGFGITLKNSEDFIKCLKKYS